MEVDLAKLVWPRAQQSTRKQNGWLSILSKETVLLKALPTCQEIQTIPAPTSSNSLYPTTQIYQLVITHWPGLGTTRSATVSFT